jgi:hypothetical protein
MGIARTADRRPILFEHRFQHLQARPDRELEQLGARIDEQIDQRQVAGRFNSGRDERLCETSSWRLLFCEAFASGLVTTRVSRAATEPPLQFSTATGTSPWRHSFVLTLSVGRLWHRKRESSRENLSGPRVTKRRRCATFRHPTEFESVVYLEAPAVYVTITLTSKTKTAHETSQGALADLVKSYTFQL